jgi:hypothetical protein
LEEPTLPDEWNELDQSIGRSGPREEGQAIEHGQGKQHRSSEEHGAPHPLSMFGIARHTSHSGQNQDSPFGHEHQIGACPRTQFTETVALAKGVEMEGDLI